MPVYNAADFIEESVQYILEQTYSDFELILINDGSTDNTRIILESLESKDSRIVLVSQSNAGPSKARNVGIDKSKGTWICFIDSDDVIEKNFLENLVWNSNHVDLIIGTFLYGGKHIDILPSQYMLPDIYELKSIYNYIHINYLGYLFSKLFLRRIIIDNNIRFDNSIKIAEDSIFLSQYFYYTQTVYITQTDGYLYKTNMSNSLSKIANIEERYISYKRNLEERKKIIQKLNISDIPIKKYYINSISYATRCLYGVNLPKLKMRIFFIKRLRNDLYFKYLGKSDSIINKISYILLKYRTYLLYDLFNLMIRMKKKWIK